MNPTLKVRLPAQLSLAQREREREKSSQHWSETRPPLALIPPHTVGENTSVQDEQCFPMKWYYIASPIIADVPQIIDQDHFVCQWVGSRKLFPRERLFADGSDKFSQTCRKKSLIVVTQTPCFSIGLAYLSFLLCRSLLI